MLAEVRQIEAERIRLRLSKAEVARRAGCHPVPVAFWLTGNKDPNVRNLRALAAAVGFRLQLVPVETPEL